MINLFFFFFLSHVNFTMCLSLWFLLLSLLERMYRRGNKAHSWRVSDHIAPSTTLTEWSARKVSFIEQLCNIIPGLMRTILVPTHRPPPHGPWLGNVWTRPCWRSAGWAGLTDWRSASWSVSAGGLARRSPGGPRTGRTWACQGAGCWCTGSTTGSPPGSRRNLANGRLEGRRHGEGGVWG